MTLTELRYIVAVAREKQFSKAAKACFVSQPTLSLGIKKLEEELGVVLFERKHQELVITPIGEKIIAQAELALKEVNIIKELAQLNQDPLSEPLRVGAIHTVGPYLFPDLLPVVKEYAPQLPLLVEENYTADLTKKLKNGDIDAAIVSLPYEEPGIELEILYEEPFVILVPTSHPLAMVNDISVSELAAETVLLLGPQHCFHDQVMDLCPDCFKSKSSADMHNIFESSSLETIRFMVAGGVGVTIVPRTAACADRYAQRLISIKHFSNGMNPTRKIALAWRKNFTRHQAIDMLASCIRECSLGGSTILEHAQDSSIDQIESLPTTKQLPGVTIPRKQITH